jgi:hypothetical protein
LADLTGRMGGAQVPLMWLKAEQACDHRWAVISSLLVLSNALTHYTEYAHSLKETSMAIVTLATIDFTHELHL